MQHAHMDCLSLSKQSYVYPNIWSSKPSYYMILKDERFIDEGVHLKIKYKKTWAW